MKPLNNYYHSFAQVGLLWNNFKGSTKNFYLKV